jgi:hypothetical protein
MSSLGGTGFPTRRPDHGETTVLSSRLYPDLAGGSRASCRGRALAAASSSAGAEGSGRPLVAQEAG